MIRPLPGRQPCPWPPEDALHSPPDVVVAGRDELGEGAQVEARLGVAGIVGEFLGSWRKHLLWLRAAGQAGMPRPDGLDEQLPRG